MGSHRKRRKLATVQKDQLDVESVSGKTIDENKSFIGWMSRDACVEDVPEVQTETRGKASLVEVFELSLHRTPYFLTCGVYQTQQTQNVECFGKLVYTPKDAVIE